MNKNKWYLANSKRIKEKAKEYYLRNKKSIANKKLLLYANK
jgi:hypothetical protein